MNPKRLLDIAVGAALSRLEHENHFRLGAAGIRHDGVLISSYNGFVRHLLWKCHAEARLMKKSTPGTIVAVARVLANGDWALARPCKNCQTCMKRKGVKRVYYTISPGEYGTMLL